MEICFRLLKSQQNATKYLYMREPIRDKARLQHILDAICKINMTLEVPESKHILSEDVIWFKNNPVALSADDDEKAKYILEH